MLTSRPRTAASGRVSIHSNLSLEELLKDSCGTKKGVKAKRKPHRSKSAGCISGQVQKEKQFSDRSNNVQFDLKCWLSERSAKSIQEKTEYESSSVRNLYSSLLENESKITEEVSDYLAENEELHRRKKYLLQKDWTENVYEPLQTEIDKEMNSHRYRMFERAKQDLYTQYLNYNNRMGNVFLDTMSCDDYDPLCLNGHRPGPLKVVTRKPKDPLLHQLAKRNSEESIVIACETGLKLNDRELEQSRLPPLPLVPLGRHGTEVNKTWLAMELHDIHSDVRQRSQKRMLGKRTDTCIDFQTWRQMQRDPELIDKELQSQKRRQFQEKHNTTILFT